MIGLFNQFKYIPLKACPLVLELELVSNFSDCVVTVGGTRFQKVATQTQAFIQMSSSQLVTHSFKLIGKLGQ